MQTDLQHSPSGVWLPGCSLTSKAVLCLHCWGWRGKQGRAKCKGEQCQGRGLPFLPYQASKPRSYAKKQAQAVVTQCQVLLGNCLWGKNVYSPQLPNYAARWAEHVKWSTKQLCLFPSLLEQWSHLFINQTFCHSSFPISLLLSLGWYLT